MGTMIYTPGVQVHIQTADHGIVDVTDDLENGTLTLAENQPSTFSFSLTNQRRKYDGVFTPNDTITVRMKRLKWLLVFSGYLNQVPYFSVYPRSIQLTATDSLKRLKYRLWDPGTPESVALLGGHDLTKAAALKRTSESDGGLRDILLQLLQKVGQWPAGNMHIGMIPANWDAKMSEIQASMAGQISVDTAALGLDGVTYGVAASSAGSSTSSSTANSSGANKIRFRTTKDAAAGSGSGDAKGIGVIPVTRGVVTVTPTVGSAILTGESYSEPQDPYFCTMQFGFGDSATFGASPGAGFSRTEYLSARQWWANQLILLTSPKTNQSVVVRAIGWGPGILGTAKIAASPRALSEIGASDGDTLVAGFAPRGSRVGLVKQPQRTPSPNLFSAPDPVVPDTVLGNSSDGSGARITSADNLRSNAKAARAFIAANWYLPRGIGGYSPQAADGTSLEADHYQGLALDVILSDQGTPATGEDLAKGNAIAEWFANNLVVHQAHYVIWQDLINYGDGWSTYGRPSSTEDTEQHRDHVHISFYPPIPLIAGDPSTYLPSPYN